MVRVDCGIDHRDQHAAAGRNLVHLGKLQLVDDILLRGSLLVPSRQVRVFRGGLIRRRLLIAAAGTVLVR